MKQKQASVLTSGGRICGPFGRACLEQRRLYDDGRGAMARPPLTRQAMTSAVWRFRSLNV